METTHRKIDLQSPADLTYLTTRLRTLASQKLDLHLPPVTDASEPDDLRKTVDELVTQFVDDIVRGMRANVAVNGMDVVRADDTAGADKMDGVESGGAHGSKEVEVEEYAPYDEKLRAQLSAAVARRDALVAKISMHRRETAARAADAWQRGFEGENEAIARAHEGALAGGPDDALLEVEVKRLEEVERNWARAVDGLTGLNKGLPETRARLERAGDVVGYLGGK